jgi:cell division septation protein DedD
MYNAGRQASEERNVISVSSANTVARALLASLLVTALLGCAARDDGWEEAVKTDTPDAYDTYLQKNPRAERAAEARVRRDALVDQRDWSVARRANSVEGYSAYLSAHPSGVWSELATRRREALLKLQPSAVVSATPPEGVASQADATPPAVAAPASVPAPAEYVVQLGAFSSNAAARQSWQRMQRSFVELQEYEPRIDTRPVKGSSLYRLRLALDSKEQGDLLCAALKRGGAECVAVLSP